MRHRRDHRRPGRNGPLRIGIVTPPYLPVPPLGYGGIERVVHLLARGLSARGHKVTVFAAPGSYADGGYRVVTPLSVPPLLGDPASVSDELYHVTSAYLRADGFDVIHDHSGIGPALAAARTAGPPVVHTLHGPWTPTARRFGGLIDRRVHLVAISQTQRTLNPSVRYAGVVYNGVDLSAHPFTAHKEDFVLFVGRVNPEKRPEVAIEIARRAGLPLVMVVKRTEETEQAYWRDVVTPRLGADVTVLDQPPHEVKVDLMGRARAMLFPIDWPEPFGLVMVEAMACGTPVIAPPLGAAAEVIVPGVTGYFARDLDAMVAAVSAAGSLRPEDCRAHVARRFSAQRMVTGYERVYRNVLDGYRISGQPAVQRRPLDATVVSSRPPALSADQA